MDFIKNDPDTQLEGYVEFIEKDKNGYVWIGTHDGLFVSDGSRIHPITHLKLHNRIVEIFLDPSNRLYIIDSAGNLFEGHTQPFKIVFLKDNFLTPPKINSRYSDNIMILQEYTNAIKQIYKNNLVYKFNKFPKGENYSPKNNFIVDTSLVVVKKNKPWEIHHPNGIIKQLETDLPWDLNTIGKLIYDKKTVYWLYKNNIYRLLIVKNTLFKVLEIQLPLSLKDIIFTFGIKNPENRSFYLGSNGQGLFEVNNVTNFDVMGFQSTEDKKIQSKNKNPVVISQGFYSQAELPDGSILINNHLILSKNGIIDNFYADQPYIRALNFIDSDGTLLYSDKNYLIKLFKNGKKEKIILHNTEEQFESYCKLNDTTSAFARPYTITILIGKTNKITIGSQDLDLNQNEFINYIKDLDQQNLLILTTKSIRVYNLKTKEIEKVKKLPESDYRIIQKLIDDYSFVGTYGNGFFIKTKDKWIKMPLDEKKHLSFAHAALLDDNGFVWISTNNGLYQTRMEDIINYVEGKANDMFYFRYDRSYGFETNEFNGGCQSPALKLKNGKFSFSSMRGLVQFDPNDFKNPYFPKNPIVINKITIDNNNLDSIPEIIYLLPNVKKVELYLSSPYYGLPTNHVLEYSLGESNLRWTKLISGNPVTLQNLSHGNYDLKVRIRRGFGNDRYEYKNIKIVVKPFFFQTIWFKTLSVIICIFAIMLSIKLLLSAKTKQNLLLKQKVYFANRELSAINEELVEQLKRNDLLQSILIHDIKSPLKFIESNSKIITQNWQKFDDNTKIRNLINISGAAIKIETFIEEMLLWIHLKNKEFTVEYEQFNIYNLFEEIIDLYKENDKIVNGKLKIINESSRDFMIKSNTILISTIIRNLLSNSIKYTPSGNIKLYAYQDQNNHITIGCNDEGEGIPLNTINIILDKSYFGNSIRNDSFRMGFIIVKEIVEILDAKLYISRNPLKGTDVKIII